MKSQPICFFNENDVVKIEDLPTDEENGKIYRDFGLEKDMEVFILWKSGKKIIVKIGENTLALSGRAAEKILASRI